MKTRLSAEDHRASEGLEASGHRWPLIEALESVREELRALDRNALLVINLDVGKAVQRVAGCLHRLGPVRAELPRFSLFDQKAFDNIERYTWALLNAESRWRAAGPDYEAIELLVIELSKARRNLVSAVEVLAAHNLMNDAGLGRLKRTKGHNAVAMDVLGLVEMFREQWGAVQGKTPVSVAELDHLGDLSLRLIDALAAERRGSDIRARALDDRQRAFTLFKNAYDEVRSVTCFLRRHQGDADKIAPPLTGGRKRKKPKADQATTEATLSAEANPHAGVTDGETGQL